MPSLPAGMTSAARILVVDDDPCIRTALAEVLEDEGYQVACASNGAEALDQLQHDDDAPSLIVLDLMMPVMDGWAFRCAQRSDPRLSGIPVLVLSAVNRPEALYGEPLGEDGFLAKPFELQRLLDVGHRLC